MNSSIDQLSDNEKKVLRKYINKLHRTVIGGTLLFSIPILPITLYSLGSFLNFDILDGVITGVLAVLLTLGIIKVFGKRGVLRWWKKAQCLKQGRFVVQREVILRKKVEYDHASIRNDSFLYWLLIKDKGIYNCYVTTEHFKNIEVYGIEIKGKTNGRWVNMQEDKLACMLYMSDINDVVCIAGGEDT